MSLIVNFLTSPQAADFVQNSTCQVLSEGCLKAVGRPTFTLLDKTATKEQRKYSATKELLYQMYKENIPIRLVGVRVGDLVKKEEVQLSLFSTENSQKQEKLDKTIDNLKQKYGYNIITRMGNSKGT